MADLLPPVRTPETAYLAAILAELRAIRKALEALKTLQTPRRGGAKAAKVKTHDV